MGEVREFLSRWHDDSGHLGKFKSGINVDGKELWLPIANLVSICALLIWYPANPNDTITRLLFPGSTPQKKVFKMDNKNIHGDNNSILEKKEKLAKRRLEKLR